MSNPQQQPPAPVDDLLDDDPPPENPSLFGENGNGQDVPTSVETKPVVSRTNVAPGSTVSQELVTKTIVPAGTRSPITGQIVGASPATQNRGATPGAGTEQHAREFLERASSVPGDMRRTANWKIHVRRQSPFNHQGVPLDTTSDLVTVGLMPAPELEAAVKGSHGGGRYRADINSDGGVWQMGWSFNIPVASCPPLVAKGQGFGPENDPRAQVAVMEAQERIDRERRRFDREEKEKEEERAERKRQREVEERERANQNPAMAMFMQGMKDMMAAMQAQTQAILTAITANKPTDNGLKDILPTLVTAMTAGKGENVEIAKLQSTAAVEQSKHAAEAAKASSEAQIKAMDSAQARIDNMMQLVIKSNTQRESPQKAVTEMFGLMKLFEDRFGPRELPEDEGAGIQALLPEIVKVIGGFIQARGSPTANMAAGALGLPQGAAPNEAQIDALARDMAPYLLRHIRGQAQQTPQGQLPPPSGAATGPATSPAPQQTGPLPPPTGTQAATPNPAAPGQPPVAAEPDPVLQSSARDRLIEQVTETVTAMFADAKDKRAAATWVDDALNWNGDFLTMMVRAPDDAARLAMMKEYCDPVLWKSFDDTMRLTPPPDREIIYNTWASGMKALVSEHAKRRGLR